MKFLFDFLFTFFISFENKCNNTTALEVNIDTDQKKTKRKNQNKFSTLVSKLPRCEYFFESTFMWGGEEK